MSKKVSKHAKVWDIDDAPKSLLQSVDRRKQDESMYLAFIPASMLVSKIVPKGAHVVFHDGGHVAVW